MCRLNGLEWGEVPEKWRSELVIVPFVVNCNPERAFLLHEKAAACRQKKQKNTSDKYGAPRIV